MSLELQCSIRFRGIADGVMSEMQAKLDAFREATWPASEWGITIWNLACDGSGGYRVDIEFANANTIDEAQIKFDAFRNAVAPSEEWDIILWHLRESDPIPTAVIGAADIHP